MIELLHCVTNDLVAFPSGRGVSMWVFSSHLLCFQLSLTLEQFQKDILKHQKSPVAQQNLN